MNLVNNGAKTKKPIKRATEQSVCAFLLHNPGSRGSALYRYFWAEVSSNILRYEAFFPSVECWCLWSQILNLHLLYLNPYLKPINRSYRRRKLSSHEGRLTQSCPKTALAALYLRWSSQKPAGLYYRRYLATITVVQRALRCKLWHKPPTQSEK